MEKLKKMVSTKAKTTLLSENEGNFLKIEHEEISVLLELVEQTRQKCYLLSLEKKAVCKRSEIIGNLMVNGLISSPQMYTKIDTLVVFVSDCPQYKLDKKIKQIFPKYSYLLVKLHKSNISRLINSQN